MAVYLHMIGNAHIDPAWLWRWQQGYAEIKATFRSALDRINEFDEFVFTCAGAAYYKWTEENCPEMFEEIRFRVAQERWIIVGGWWIQPDCNIPCGESFVRQGLYGQRYFTEKFGKAAKVGYNVDSFGHNGMLPQILSKSGMDCYVFMRPDKNEKSMGSELFIWEGVDSTKVKAFRIQLSYGNWFETEGDIIQKKNEAIFALAQQQDMDFMSFYGVGNHGGGPTIDNLRSIIRLKEEGSNIKFGSPNTYFEEVEAQNYKLPVYKGDLQHHASGCYSAHAGIKALNRRAEISALTAEKLMCLARELTGFEYDIAAMKRVWENIMFNQFHDIICGCSIKDVYKDAGESYGEALAISSRLINAALQKISWAVDTSRGADPVVLEKKEDFISWETDQMGVPVLVCNTLSFDVLAPIQLGRNYARVEDSGFCEAGIQTVRAQRTNKEDKWDTLFVADVPANGYRVYWAYLKKESGEINLPGSLSAGENYLENGWIRAEFDTATGNVTSLYDKEKGIRLVKNGNMLVMDETEMDTWAHGVFKFDKVLGEFSDAKTEVIENGPLRCVLRIVTSYGQSLLTQDYILYRHKKGLEVKARIDFREKHKMLKLSFDTCLEDTKAVYEIPYGFIEKAADGNEEPAQMWAAVEGAADSGGRGCLAILNDSKYSYSVEGSAITMTALRGCAYADHFGARDSMMEYIEWGIHEFCYEILSCDPAEKADIVKAALALNYKPVSITETYHKGVLPLSYKGVEIDRGNVLISAVKISEDEDGYVLRCHETGGKSCEAEIKIAFLNRKISACFTPYEIKTIKIPFDKKENITEVNMLEYDDFVR